MVDADSGNIGGSKSNEFHVIADTGEDDLLIDKDGVGINFEIAKEKYKTDDIEKISSENGLIHKKGIEVGHIFKLGDKYSKSMNLSIADSENNNHFLQMGCYGIGVSRMVAASIEQCNDEKGIIWPKAIAPYDVAIVPVGYNKNEKIKNFADSIYKKLIENNIQPLLDDRDISAGAIFSDNDLIGTPIQIIIGKKFLDGNEVEIKDRSTNEYISVSTKSCMETVLKML